MNFSELFQILEHAVFYLKKIISQIRRVKKNLEKNRYVFRQVLLYKKLPGGRRHHLPLLSFFFCKFKFILECIKQLCLSCIH